MCKTEDWSVTLTGRFVTARCGETLAEGYGNGPKTRSGQRFHLSVNVVWYVFAFLSSRAFAPSPKQKDGTRRDT